MSRRHRLVLGGVVLAVLVVVLGLPGGGPERRPAAPGGAATPSATAGPQRLASLLECLAAAGVSGLSSADPPAVLVAEVTRQQPGESAGRRCLVAHTDVVGPVP